MPVALHRRIGQLVVVGFDGNDAPGRDSARSPASSISAASSCSRATSNRPSRWPRWPSRPSSSPATCRSGWAWTRRAAASRGCGAAHRVAADGARSAGRATRRSPSGSPRRWPRNCSPSASRSTSRRCSTSSPTRRTRRSATARSATARTRSRGSARRSCEGSRSSGLAACGKHFPGHGDTGVDSHLDLPLVEHAPDRLQAVDFVPFRAAIEAGVAAIMTGHLLVPSLDEQTPGHAVAGRIVTGVLRGELGFDGLVFTDDLDMKAISGRTPEGPGGGGGDRGRAATWCCCAAPTSRRTRPRSRRWCTRWSARSCPGRAWRTRSSHQRRAKERFASMSGTTLEPPTGGRCRRPRCARSSAATSTRRSPPRCGGSTD